MTQTAYQREAAMPGAIGYRRMSKDKGDGGLGLLAQRQAIEREAQRLDLPVVATFTDNDVSGGAPIDKRVGLLDALKEIRAGDVLIVARRDRLARDVLLAGWIEKEVQKRGARIVSAAGEGNGSANDPASKLMRTIIDAFAEYERALIRARTRAALATRRAAGKRVSRFAPFGYRFDGDRVVEDAKEQRAVRMMVELRGRGLSLGDLSARLARRGFNSRAGTPISRRTIAAALKGLQAERATVRP